MKTNTKYNEYEKQVSYGVFASIGKVADKKIIRKRYLKRDTISDAVSYFIKNS